MLRRSTAERIKILIRDQFGDPKTGLVAADFQGTAIYVIKADGTVTTISLVLATNFFEVNSTTAPGVYEFILTTASLAQYGQVIVSFQPAVALTFSPTYLQDWVDDAVTAVKAKTDLLPSVPASQGDVTSATSSIKGTQNLDISTIAGGALFNSVTDNLHALKTAITGVGTGVANAVWEELLNTHINPGTFGELLNLLNSVLTNRVKIDRATKSLTVFAADSVTPLKTYQLFDINGAAADVTAAERRKAV
jgi:hypothetical protein